jgi:hypothetical protein
MACVLRPRRAGTAWEAAANPCGSNSQYGRTEHGPRRISLTTTGPWFIHFRVISLRLCSGARGEGAGSYHLRNRSPPDSIQFMDVCLTPSRLKRRLADLTLEPFHTDPHAISLIYLLQNSHKFRFSRCSICLRHRGSMVVGK